MLLQYALLAILVCGLFAISWHDIRSHRIPNAITYPLIALGLVYHGFVNGDLTGAFGGMLLGYLGFVLVETSYRRLRNRDGLGRGDAKLLAVGGAWCGWTGLASVLLVGSASALIWALILALRSSGQTLKQPIPFGPFLSFGIIHTILTITLY
jgi:leader peptidase (prepilin peptidase)/N-methyltransferase